MYITANNIIIYNIIYNNNPLSIIHCFTQKWGKMRTFSILNTTYVNYEYYCKLDDSFLTVYEYTENVHP